MKNRHETMPIGERELTVLTADLDEAHHATLPAMHEAISELSEQLRESTSGHTLNRRAFLIAGTAVGGSIALAACGSSGSSISKNTVGGSATTTKAGSKNVDLAVAALAAGTENLAVKTYQTALDAAAAGKLGTVPPAVATFITTAMAQHKDHAEAWNKVLVGAGKSKVTGINITVDDAVVQPALEKVKTVGDVAALALVLEDAASATYLNGIQNALTLPAAIKIAATIQPVEMQHAAILNLLLGNYPVPNSFAMLEGARPPTDKIG